MNLRWWERPMRIAALQMESDGDPLRVLQCWREHGFNVEQLLHISAKGWHGVFDEEKLASIERYIAEAHQMGMKIIFYYGGHWLSEKIRAAHPDWAVRRSDGTLLSNACLNNDGYIAWMSELTRKMVKAGADGVFFDGAVFPENTCYCEKCSRDFAAQTGLALNDAASDADTAEKFVEFKLQAVERYLAAARAALKAANPDAVFYVNGPGLHSSRRNGYETRRTAKYQDLIGAEGGFGYYEPARNALLWKASATAKLLEAQSDGKPRVIFIAGDHKLWNWYYLTGPETVIHYAGTIANGASPWYGLHSNKLDVLAAPGPQAAKRMNRFIAENEEYLAATRSAARVALLHSRLNAENYNTTSMPSDFAVVQAQKKEGMFGHFQMSWSGAYEALYRSQVFFDLIDEESPLAPDRYQLLFLPTVGCMSDETAENIRDYVSEGGNVFATFDTSCFYPDGSRRPQPALAEVFGIKTDFAFHNMHRASYIKVNDPGHPLCGNLSQSLIPSPSFAMEVTATTATALMHFLSPLRSQYQPLTEPMSPALLVNQFGRGAAIYIPSTFFESYWLDRICDYRQLVTAVVAMYSRPLVSFANLPPAVEVTLRAQKNRYILHLINLAGDMNRPLEWVAPIRDIEIRFHGAAASARALAMKQELPLEPDSENGVSCILPVLENYEAVVFENVAPANGSCEV